MSTGAPEAVRRAVNGVLGALLLILGAVLFGFSAILVGSGVQVGYGLIGTVAGVVVGAVALDLLSDALGNPR